MNLIQRLWQDERGFVVSSELILVATIVVIGLIVGLVAFRDSVVQEMGDSGAAVGAMQQTYSIDVLANGETDETLAPVITVAGDGTVTVNRDFGDVEVTSTFDNFSYTDNPDLGDDPDVAGDPPAGIMINLAPDDEGP